MQPSDPTRDISASNGAHDEQDLHDAVDIALSHAAKKGASGTECAASLGEGLSVSVRLGEVETIEHNRDRGLVVTVYVGQRSGSASTSDYRRDAVLEAVESALSIARLTEEDAANGLPDPDRLATEFPDLDLYHPVATGVDALTDIANRCEASARAVDARITNSEGASASADRGVEVLANSLGFRGVTRKTRFSTSCAVIGSDSSGMQRDYWYHAARSPEDLESPESIGERAGRRTVRRLGGRRISTRQAPVLFEAPVASSLLGHLVSAVSGGALYKKASFLVDQAGQQLFPEFVRIRERPLLARAMGSTAFDGEGVATSARDLVKDGVLQGYVLSSYSARRLGLQTTGNAGGVHNLSIDPGEDDFEALLRRMGSGLLVTELVGFGINNVTGDYSRGAAGFWVENGVISHPVEEITIAGNLRNMYRNLVAAGSDVDTRGNVRTGSLLVDGMTIAGE